MKRKIFWALMSLGFIACNNTQITPSSLAKDVVNVYGKHASMSYDIDYKIKYFSQTTDTATVFAQIDLVRNQEDTILGGHIYIHGDSIDRYYDTKNLYYIEHNKKSITKYPGDKPYPITGNIIREAVRVYFLKPERLIKDSDDSTFTIDVLADQMTGNEVLKWSCTFPDEEEMKNASKNIWFDKENLTVNKMTYTTDFQHENQYNQWDISNVSFNKISADDLKNRFAKISENYTMNDYKERSKEEMAPLAKGLSIPDLTGEFYLSGDSITIEDYKGELLLLDFWYMDCYPCVKAIPHLNELQNKYSNQGFKVIGINPYNNNEKDLGRFPKFLSHNEIDYPILFMNRDETKNYKIHAYPTFYLINQQGAIIHSGVGFSEDSMGKIDSLIQVNL